MVVKDCRGKYVDINSAHVQVDRDRCGFIYTVFGEYVGSRLCVLKSFVDAKSALDYVDQLKEAIALNEDFEESELRESEEDLPFAPTS